MLRNCTVFVGLIFLCVSAFSQDFDSDFRICDGLPRSQKAFAMALGDGSLRGVATKILADAHADIDSNIQLLFSRSAPSSLTDLNSRVDLYVKPVELANNLQMAFNSAVASKFQSASVDNIVCSMSLLSYREASDVFGKRIATQYGVVQVTIRNTDGDHEFLLHQVDFWFGDTLQYYATRDRKIARGVAEKGQVLDPRNLTVRILEGIGAVAGPTTNVFSNDAQLASSIFNSSFIPAVKTAFPDLTVQQIAKLDDMGFSAGASTMVIPKSGAISFVAFIPSDSFLVPKLAQYEAGMDSKSELGKKIQNCSKWQNQQLVAAMDAAKAKNGEMKTSKTPESKQTDARTDAICNEVLAPQASPMMGALSSESVRAAKGKSKKVGLTSMVTFHRVHHNIGSFDPATVLLLQKDLHIMVSGSHIQALTTQLAVTSATCSMPDPLVSDSAVSCALTGNNLNLLTQGRLISQTDSTTAVQSNGLKADKTDPAHAQLSFPGCSFVNKPQGNYLLEVSGTGGTTQLSFSQSLRPNGFTCKRGVGGITCQLPNGVSAAQVTLTGSDKAAHTFPVVGSTANAGALTPGTYDASATAGGKTLTFCSVTF